MSNIMFTKPCGHGKLVWCACDKWTTPPIVQLEDETGDTSAYQYLGYQPNLKETRMFRPTFPGQRNPEPAEGSEKDGLDEVDDFDMGYERYGATGEDSAHA